MLLRDIPTGPMPKMEVPETLWGLRRMAMNLYWAWHPEVREVFARLDPEGWENTHSPLAVLLGRPDFERFMDDTENMALYQKSLAEFDAYLAGEDEAWFSARARPEHKVEGRGPIAYFCAEYGLHESVPIYSGGLGVLAGDHLKAASDMGVPCVGVGLFYRRGYFRQIIEHTGRQEHAYPKLDPKTLPVLRVLDPQTQVPLNVQVNLPGRTVHAGVWVVQVGRIPLLLLDTTILENRPADRPITHLLYVQGREMRLHQEMVLGVGGVRALRALSIEPSAWHLNEGHSAFMVVERLSEKIRDGISVDDAFDQLGESSVFTIHTPVPAGNERFDAGLVRELTGPMVQDGHLPLDRILEMGRGADGDPNIFDMTAFCLRVARGQNGVSQLHAATANGTWEKVTAKKILGITNGVHMATWLGRPMRGLFARHGVLADRLALEMEDRADRDAALAAILSDIPDADLWDSHHLQKEALMRFCRQRLFDQLDRHGVSPRELDEALNIFDPGALTIGFARRFATYKRASLLFSDMDRLVRLVNNPDRPVQLLFAGKAHPADRPGQGLIADIFTRSREKDLRGKVLFIENYDMGIGRALTQGVDVWLNNPRRPLEASGTSGMKAAANGIPNLSVLDGWWDEGYAENNGWAIGGRESAEDHDAQDRADAESLYRLLEEKVVPAYYGRNDQGFSPEWVEIMRHASASVLWHFSADRMMGEYVKRLYLPR
jgi:starch phosphorylase